MLSPKENKLQQLKQRILNKESGGDITTSIFYLIKELKCLGDVIGREYEVIYDSKGRISRIRQLPMPISTLNILFKELDEDSKRQEREMKKAKHKGRKR